MPASILIADPSSAVRTVVERAIRLANLPVSACHLAAGSADVRRLCASQRIDFALLDTQIGGIEAAGQAVPFMVVSADASSASMERWLALGASAYVLKPFSIPTLVARLKEALAFLHVHGN